MRKTRLDRLERRFPRAEGSAPSWSWPLMVDAADPEAVGSVAEGEAWLQSRGRGIAPTFKSAKVAEAWKRARGTGRAMLIVVVPPPQGQEDAHA